MLNFITKTVIITSITLFSLLTYAQVGLGTTTPNAALEIKSTTTGFLPPRVTLTATNVEAPVINPQGGGILEGTMVYNVTETAGTYGVTPGLYFWNGSRWVSQYQRKFNKTFTQTASKLYTTGDGYSTITGISGLSFTAPYDGVYQFIFSGYLGAVQVDDNDTNIRSSDDISGYAAVGFVEGRFKVTIESTDYEKYNYSTSFYRSGDGSDGSGGTDIYQLMNEVTMVINVTMTSGQACNFDAAYDPMGDDNLTSSNGHIVGETVANYGNLCELNVTYIGRN
ncbi:MAG: hypothetical protein COA88_14960 [Kordia sp.]|nr:MAG: hypothetical protein COA88_14960 [Kordia sp.]